MIIVKLKGGLGNQMFQYAFGKKISIDRKTNLKFDKTFLENTIWQKLTGVTVRAYELGEFNVKAQFSKFWQRNNYFDGYWQNEKYFKKIKPILLKDFTLRNKSDKFLKFKKMISNTNSVSIHIRRGDYVERKVTKDYHGVLGFDYYFKAFELIGKKTKHPRFFIFSDDPTISSFSGLTDGEELILMSKCKHNIIANSSFSWWGAWLNKNPSKIVIAPKKWFGVGVKNTVALPKEWIRI